MMLDKDLAREIGIDMIPTDDPDVIAVVDFNLKNEVLYKIPTASKPQFIQMAKMGYYMTLGDLFSVDAPKFDINIGDTEVWLYIDGKMVADAMTPRELEGFFSGLRCANGHQGNDSGGQTVVLTDREMLLLKEHFSFATEDIEDDDGRQEWMAILEKFEGGA